MQHKDKTCLVIGGTHGIGLAIAKKLAAEGAKKVMICSRKLSSLTAALEMNENFVGTTCNVSDQNDILRLVEFVKNELKDSSLDILVSNVGVDPVAGKILDATEAVFDKIFNTNVKAAWMVLKLTRSLMKPGSSILLVSSIGGLQPSFPSGLYGASKSTLISLGRALASELGPDGIRINVICPGLVKTRMSEAFWKGPYGKIAEENLFLRRLGEPDDVASVGSFLLSNAAGWMTGEAIVVSGGTHTRL